MAEIIRNDKANNFNDLLKAPQWLENRLWELLRAQKFYEESQKNGPLAEILKTKAQNMITDNLGTFLARTFGNDGGINSLDDPKITTTLLFEESISSAEKVSDIMDIDVASFIEISSSLAKSQKTFNEAHRQPIVEIRRDLLKQVQADLDDVLIRLPETAKLSRAATFLLANQTLHDLAFHGEYGNSKDAFELAVSGLWDAADTVNDFLAEENSATNAKIAAKKLLDKIEYFRGKYSDEIGLDPHLRPTMTESSIKKILDSANKALGRAALDNLATLPHAA